ncbi:MAG: 4-hydroxy-3-methylbut-2-enyl diphosphate reductase [Lachnospiraceae bacterium]|jgi:4-hydroxy-3-methylbut-2-enyl diphosphate reductase|nr:4-hydroxy-3-methylbut-2-enyl diphosphate reductase [Lachnospiraceae bacterium]
MKIELAKSAGFCFGVKRAVDTVYEQVEKNKDYDIFTYGPIIHNKQVISELKEKNVRIINDFKELQDLISRYNKKQDNDLELNDSKFTQKDQETSEFDNNSNNSGDILNRKLLIIIRSHGVGKEVYNLLEKTGTKYIDATCPFVKKIHKIVEENSGDDKEVIIIGNKNHPEVQGITGWAKGNVKVIEEASETRDISYENRNPLTIVAQTTQNKKKFNVLVEILRKKSYDCNVLDTICNATKVRQDEALEIAKRVDSMIVIGDNGSSNSRKLFEICRSACDQTYFIENIEDLSRVDLSDSKTIGMTASASTPNKIIEEVQSHVRTNF